MFTLQCMVCVKYNLFLRVLVKNDTAPCLAVDCPDGDDGEVVLQAICAEVWMVRVAAHLEPREARQGIFNE